MGCRRDESGGSPFTPPPLDTFEVTLEVPPAQGKEPQKPPEPVLEPFRVWVNQETPRQKKAPEWRSVPAKQGVVLDMAPDGKWACVVNPVRVFGAFDDDAQVMHWTTSRTLRCSGDQWKTSVEGLVRVGYTPDGKRTQSDPRAALYLKDTVDGKPRVTVVVLETQSSG